MSRQIEQFQELEWHARTTSEQDQRHKAIFFDSYVPAVMGALLVPEVWSEAEREALDAAFRRASEKHGHYETLFAVAAESLRLAQQRALLAKDERA